MAHTLISDAEKAFIIQGVQVKFLNCEHIFEDNIRNDGRSCLEYRVSHFESGTIPTCAGSAHVRLANTDVLVGVKPEIDRPNPSFPKRGRIEFFVDCTANADPEFEGTGGSELAADVTSALSQAFRGQRFFDLESLCIVSGKQVWVLHVDILILEFGGSLHDAVSLAVKAALDDTKLPQVVVNNGEDGEPELEVVDDPFAVDRLKVDNVPCFVTLSRIGQRFVVDATTEELECSVGNIVVAVDPKGRIAAIIKTGSGSIHHESVEQAVQLAHEVGVCLHKKLTVNLAKAEKENGLSNGFLIK